MSKTFGSGSIHLQTVCNFCPWISSATPCDPRRARFMKNLHMRTIHPEYDFKQDTSLSPTTGRIRSVFEKPCLSKIDASGRMNQPKEMISQNGERAYANYCHMINQTMVNQLFSEISTSSTSTSSTSKNSSIKKRSEQRKKAK